jgi:hypothetical protein
MAVGMERTADDFRRLSRQSVTPGFVLNRPTAKERIPGVEEVV